MYKMSIDFLIIMTYTKTNIKILTTLQLGYNAHYIQVFCFIS
nr:MAG TPA: hypothetical protein [Caudoviricetes sp.]